MLVLLLRIVVAQEAQDTEGVRAHIILRTENKQRHALPWLPEGTQHTWFGPNYRAVQQSGAQNHQPTLHTASDEVSPKP